MPEAEHDPPKAKQPKPEEAAAQEAVAETVQQIPVVTADEAVKYDAEREANQAGWERTAAELNEMRPWHDKWRDQNKWTAEDVMVDEAQRVNAEIEAQKPDEISRTQFAKEIEARDGEPPKWDYLDEVTNQSVFGELRKNEKKERQQGRRRTLSGPHHGREYGNEPIFTPKGEQARSAAHEIRIREEQTKSLGEVGAKALEAGGILVAEGLMAKDHDRFMGPRYDAITMAQYISPSLQELVGQILNSGSKEKMGDLVSTRYLSDYLTFDMARTAGVTQETIKKMGWDKFIVRRAADDIQELGPRLKDTTASGRETYAEELRRRFEVLSRAGILTRDQLCQDWQVKEAAVEVTSSAMVRNVARGSQAYLPAEGWELLRLGALDLERLVNDPVAINAAVMELAVGNQKLEEKAKAELRKEILGEEEAAEAA